MGEQLKITYLPTAPIRYSGSVPSMSRRGGVRVHPIKDGGLNPSAAQEQIRRRDIGGNKLVDVVDRDTGFVTGTRSSLESAPNYGAGQSKPTRPPVSGQKSGQLKNLPEAVLVCDKTGERVYLDENGRRIRTLDMGEDMIPAVPRGMAPVTGAKPVKQEGSVSGRPVKSSGATRATVPGTRSGNGRITDEDVRDYLRALYRKAKKPVPASFTKQQMHQGKLGLAERIAAARKALGGQ